MVDAEIEATSHGMLAATRSWKRDVMDYPLEPLERAQPWQRSDLDPVALISDFRPPEL